MMRVIVPGSISTVSLGPRSASSAGSAGPVTKSSSLGSEPVRMSHAASDAGPVLDGVRRIVEQATTVLAGLGYPRQDEVGVPFDPNRHEVVAVVDDPDVEPGTVVAVLRPGYGDGPAQLRPAAVAVSRQPG